MDNAVLKKTLYDQFEPLDVAVQKKLDYLNSDDVFAIETNSFDDLTDEEQNLSIEDAFSAFASAQPHNTVDTVSPGLNRVPTRPTTSATSAQSTQPTEEKTVDTSKQSLAARIAALRGISMSGDYLKK